MCNKFVNGIVKYNKYYELTRMQIESITMHFIIEKFNKWASEI